MSRAVPPSASRKTRCTLLRARYVYYALSRHYYAIAAKRAAPADIAPALPRRHAPYYDIITQKAAHCVAATPRCRHAKHYLRAPRATAMRAAAPRHSQRFSMRRQKRATLLSILSPRRAASARAASRHADDDDEPRVIDIIIDARACFCGVTPRAARAPRRHACAARQRAESFTSLFHHARAPLRRRRGRHAPRRRATPSAAAARAKRASRLLLLRQLLLYAARLCRPPCHAA